MLAKKRPSIAGTVEKLGHRKKKAKRTQPVPATGDFKREKLR
jgi:hypothetical protein